MNYFMSEEQIRDKREKVESGYYLDLDFKRISYTQGKEKERMDRCDEIILNTNYELYSRLTRCKDLSFIQGIYKRLRAVLENRASWNKLNIPSKRVILGLLVHMDLADTIRFRSESGSYYKNEDKARYYFYADITHDHNIPECWSGSALGEYYYILMSMNKIYIYDTYCLRKRMEYRGYDTNYMDEYEDMEDLPGGIRAEIDGYF